MPFAFVVNGNPHVEIKNERKRLLGDTFDGDDEFDVAAFGAKVEVDAKIRHGDLRGGFKAAALSAPRVGAGADVLDVEVDLFWLRRARSGRQ